MYTKQEVNKDTFPQLFKEMMVEKNKQSLQPERVREGEWPFKVNKGTLWKVGLCIYFKCEYIRITKRKGLFAINGNAIDNRRLYHAKKLPKHLRKYRNKTSAHDIIAYGIRM